MTNHVSRLPCCRFRMMFSPLLSSALTVCRYTQPLGVMIYTFFVYASLFHAYCTAVNELDCSTLFPSHQSLSNRPLILYLSVHGVSSLVTGHVLQFRVTVLLLFTRHWSVYYRFLSRYASCRLIFRHHATMVGDQNKTQATTSRIPVTHYAPTVEWLT